MLQNEGERDIQREAARRNEERARAISGLCQQTSSVETECLHHFNISISPRLLAALQFKQ